VLDRHPLEATLFDPGTAEALTPAPPAGTGAAHFAHGVGHGSGSKRGNARRRFARNGEDVNKASGRGAAKPPSR